MNKRIISIILTGCILLSFTGCDNASGNNRETTAGGETKNTVNPELSGPDQSIPSDAMITETESTIDLAKYSNKYIIRNVEFTISHPIEDYLYDLPGSDRKQIDLDGFMEAYGFHNYGTGWAEQRSYYFNDDGVSVDFNSKETNVYYRGMPVVHYSNFWYGEKIWTEEEGALFDITLNDSFELDKDREVYVVNGNILDGKLYENYCISKPMLVAYGYAMDCLNETGSTAGAVDLLSRAFDVRDDIRFPQDYPVYHGKEVFIQ